MRDFLASDDVVNRTTATSVPEPGVIATAPIPAQLDRALEPMDETRSETAAPVDART